MIKLYKIAFLNHMVLLADSRPQQHHRGDLRSKHVKQQQQQVGAGIRRGYPTRGDSRPDLPVPSGKGVLQGPPTTTAATTTTTILPINIEMYKEKSRKKVQFSCKDIRDKIKRKRQELVSPSSAVENILANHDNHDTQVSARSALLFNKFSLLCMFNFTQF